MEPAVTTGDLVYGFAFTLHEMSEVAREIGPIAKTEGGRNFLWVFDQLLAGIANGTIKPLTNEEGAA